MSVKEKFFYLLDVHANGKEEDTLREPSSDLILTSLWAVETGRLPGAEPNIVNLWVLTGLEQDIFLACYKSVFPLRKILICLNVKINTINLHLASFLAFFTLAVASSTVEPLGTQGLCLFSRLCFISLLTYSAFRPAGLLGILIP